MKIYIALTQIAILFFLATPSSAKKLLVDIDLKWKPTTELTEIEQISRQLKAELGSDLSFQLEKIKDERLIVPLTRIGENKEEPQDFLPVETQNNIADFVEQSLLELLKKTELFTTKNSNTALNVHLKTFFVTETNTYQGEATLQFQIKKNGKVISQQLITGKGTRFGRSYKLDNYMETLSDSMIDAFKQWISGPEFKKAFQTKKSKS